MIHLTVTDLTITNNQKVDLFENKIFTYQYRVNVSQITFDVISPSVPASRSVTTELDFFSFYFSNLTFFFTLSFLNV